MHLLVEASINKIFNKNEKISAKDINVLLSTSNIADPLEVKVNNAESVSVSKRHQGQLHVVSQVFSLVVATYRVIVQ